MILRPVLIVLPLLLTFITISAQTQNERPWRVFATQAVHQRLLAEHPDYADRLKNMEDHILNYGDAGNDRKDTIPVVFHILYATGQSFPGEEQIQAQLEALNRDFRSYEPSSVIYPVVEVAELTKRSTDPGIYFCLADKSLAGTSADGLHFVSTPVSQWGLDDRIKQESAGGAKAVEPGRVLNIWVGRLGEGKAGYAQLPGGPAETDGIVIDSRYLAGSADTFVNKFYHQGKTLTHLMGSYLGLYELWNETEPCSNDFVDDTPIHNAPNFFPGDIYYHVSLCDTTYPAEMIMNFMDNTDDEVLSLFTPGQKKRMKAVLAPDGPRAGLVAGGISPCIPDGLRPSEDRNAANRAKETAPALFAFPNPANQIINIRLISSPQGKVTCSAVSALGATVWSRQYQVAEISATGLQVDCSAWPPGAYALLAVFDNGAAAATRLTIEKP